MSIDLIPTKLYRLRDELPDEEMGICLAAGIEPGEVLWLVGNRRGCMGDYIGHFRQTYLQVNGYSPTGKTWPNMPMRYFEPID